MNKKTLFIKMTDHNFIMSFVSLYNMFIVLFLSSSSCYRQSLNSSAMSRNDTYNTEIVFRVVNGRPGKLGDIAFRMPTTSHKRYKTFCGGTIVGRDKIISAAHCFQEKAFKDCCKSLNLNGKFKKAPFHRVSKKKLQKAFAVAGTLTNKDTYQRNDSTEHGQWRQLSTAHIPRDYKFPTSDIAVVRTAKSFIFNENVNSIPTASIRKEYSGTCLVSGYGRISDKKRSPILYLADLEVIPTPKCSLMHKTSMVHFVCTSTKVSRTRKGDSGGPLVCKNTGDLNDKGKGVLVGVVSGHRRILKTDMTFFTRVTSHKNFIRQASSCLLICKLLILVNSLCFIF